MKPLGIIRMPLVSSIRPNVRYMTLRAPHRSLIHPPTGRNSEAGKMNVAVSRPATVRLTPKLST